MKRRRREESAGEVRDAIERGRGEGGRRERRERRRNEREKEGRDEKEKGARTRARLVKGMDGAGENVGDEGKSTGGR